MSAVGASIATAAPEGPPASGAAEADVTSWTASGSEQAVLDFWTPERVRQAAANPLPVQTVSKEAADKARELAAQHIDTSIRKTKEVVADAVAPLRPRQDTAQASPLATTSIGDLSRSDLAATLGGKTKITGRLFFDVDGETLGTCSAAVIVSNNKNSIWTAGHCLHSGKGGNFFSKFVFAPGYDETAPWGFWPLKNIIVSSAWADDSDNLWGDMGGGIVAPLSQYGNLQEWVGAYGYRFNSESDIAGVTAIGYPVDGYNRPSSDFHDGAKPMYCHGNAFDAGNWNPFDDRLKLSCDMGHGASGGPMVAGLDGNSQIVGVNSHRLADGNNNWVDNYMYSSNHGSSAAGVMSWLNSH
ncbi:trypsin-like serine peptidase [Kitasatospora sp. NPDC054768]